MSKTFKDKPEAYKQTKKEKPKEGKRFVPTKGRKRSGNLKDLVRDGINLEDYFI